MEVLHFTIFFSVLLAAIFLFLLAIANWKGWFSKPEQDSLIPLAKDSEIARDAATESKSDSTPPHRSSF